MHNNNAIRIIPVFQGVSKFVLQKAVTAQVYPQVRFLQRKATPSQKIMPREIKMALFIIQSGLLIPAYRIKR